MVAALADHLWQSLLVFVLVLVMLALTRRNPASVRLWLWRIAAAKLALPFDALVAIGAWYEFPVSHVSEPPPAQLLWAIGSTAPWLAPARHLEPSGWMPGLSLLGLSIAAAVALRSSLRGQRVESFLRNEEQLRLERDPDDRPPAVTFLTAALMTSCAALMVGAALTTGAVAGLQQHQARLAADARALRAATVVLMPAKPGMGSRSRVLVDPTGVSIRNVTLRELTALAYGVGWFAVYGNHFYESGGTDWLIAERHDVRISGPIRDVDAFDPYALREPLTRALAERFGLEIYLNAKCQPPCGNWGMPMDDN